MLRYLEKLLCITLFVIPFAFSRELPSWINLCDKKDSSFQKCVIDNMQIITKKASKGDLGLEYALLDPLSIDHIEVKDTPGKAVILNQDFRNVMLKGLSDTNITDIKMDFEKCQFKIRTFAPRSEMTGDYSVQGNLLLFQVKGSGKFNITLNDVVGIDFLACEYYEKDNEKYIRFKNAKTQIRPGGGHIYFENIIAGNDELSMTVNNLLNENFKDIIQEFSSTITDLIAKELKKFANSFVKDVPVSKMFKN